MYAEPNPNPALALALALALAPALALTLTQALLRLATGLDRQQTAPAAPPEGLCLARVGYGAYSE